MSSAKAAANLRSSGPAGKQSLLPPKCPFPIVSATGSDYGSIVLKGMSIPRDPPKHHQRTSSESFLINEQPSWLDDLLNEPETPVRRGAHRRSSSDSFSYLDGSNIYSNLDNITQEDCQPRNVSALSPWVSHEFDSIVDAKHRPYYVEGNSYGRPQKSQNSVWEFASMNAYPRSASIEDNIPPRPMTFASADTNMSASDVGNIKVLEANQDLKGPSEKMEGFNSKQPEVDQKRAKQQFAQRSRARKLQYINELERNAQALQAEGLEVAAELEFMDQRNHILNLENKTLKQRLDSLAQEQLIKCRKHIALSSFFSFILQFPMINGGLIQGFCTWNMKVFKSSHVQQEMLEREIARLRTLYQQQQQQQPHATPNYGRNNNSRDLDSQFSSLSLKHKDPNSGRDTVTGPVHI